MWKGRALQILGLWVIVSALMHNSPNTTGLINTFTGLAVLVFGIGLRDAKPWQGLIAGFAGLLLMILAFVPSARIHTNNLWIDSAVGALIWFCGWRVVASEMGGPWHLKDGPII
jgi:hypothetical protein